MGIDSYRKARCFANGKENVMMFTRFLRLFGVCLVVVTFCVEWASAQDVSYGQVARQDLKNAYAIAQTYFTDDPGGALEMADLYGYGFRRTDSETIKIVNGRRDHLVITGGKYIVDKDGRISIRGVKGQKVIGSKSGR